MTTGKLFCGDVEIETVSGITWKLPGREKRHFRVDYPDGGFVEFTGYDTVVIKDDEATLTAEGIEITACGNIYDREGAD